MINYIQSNIGTIAVSLVLAAAVALIITKLVKDKKQGKSSCGCGCASCAMSGTCHKNSQQ